MLELFLTFFRIGLFTFGGGYAMISLIEDVCVEKKKWLTHEQMLELTVVAESTPGPIAINCATYAGFLQGGFPGSVAATLGVVLPSFLIIYTISMFLDNFLALTLIANAFRGIKAAVGLLILNAGVNMAKQTKGTPISRGIMAVSLGILLLSELLAWNFSSLSLMLLAGAFHLLLVLRQRKGGNP